MVGSSGHCARVTACGIWGGGGGGGGERQWSVEQEVNKLKCTLRYIKFNHMTTFQVRDWL